MPCAFAGRPGDIRRCGPRLRDSEGVRRRRCQGEDSSPKGWRGAARPPTRQNARRRVAWPRDPCACSSSPGTRRSTPRAGSCWRRAPAATRSRWPTRSTSASSSPAAARRSTWATTPLPHTDLVLPRIGASITNYGLAVVRQFDLMGVPVLNTALAIARSRDKLRALQLLTKKNIDVPVTVCARTPDSIERRLVARRRPPLHRQAPAGSPGHRNDDRRDPPGGHLAARDPLGDGSGHHPSAVHRRGEGARSAGHRRRRPRRRLDAAPGQGRRVPLQPAPRGPRRRCGASRTAYRRAAVAATRVMGLEVAGVDMLETREGPKILEINSSPGPRGHRARERDRRRDGHHRPRRALSRAARARASAWLPSTTSGATPASGTGWLPRGDLAIAPVTLMYPPSPQEGYYGPFGGRFVAETLIPALDELDAGRRDHRTRRMPSRRSGGGCSPATWGARRPLGEATRLARAIDPAGRGPRAPLAQARGPLPHGRAQDQQRPRAGAARQEDGQDAHHRRDGGRPARRRHGHGVRALRPALRGLHGGGGRRAAGAQRRAHAAARRAGSCPSRAASRTLKDAMNEALRDWVTNVRTTHYCIGSAAGPHPYPELVAMLQSVIGEEARAQVLAAQGALPDGGRRLRRRRLERHRHLPRLPRTTRPSRSSASRPRARALPPGGTRRR